MIINQRLIVGALFLVISASLNSFATAATENRDPLFVQTDGRIALQLSAGWNTFYSPFMYPQALLYPYPLFVNPCYPYVHCGAFNQYRCYRNGENDRKDLRVSMLNKERLHLIGSHWSIRDEANCIEPTKMKLFQRIKGIAK